MADINHATSLTPQHETVGASAQQLLQQHTALIHDKKERYCGSFVPAAVRLFNTSVAVTDNITYFHMCCATGSMMHVCVCRLERSK